MKIMCSFGSVALLIVGFTSCHHYGSEQYRALAWKTNQTETGNAADGHERAKTADQAPYPEVTYGWVSGKADLGIAFSGGGNRAATMTLGQLRALNELGVLKRAKYISAVSGGTWCAIPYTFLPDASRERDALFLGRSEQPEELGWSRLGLRPERGSFARCATKAGIDWMRVFHGKGDENYAHVLSGIYLKDHDLNHANRFVAYDRAQVDRIIAANRDAQLQPKNFIVSAAGRPYLVANAVILHKWERFSDGLRFRPFEFTPGYSGARYHTGRSDFNPGHPATYTPAGGGYVETFAYDSVLQSASHVRGQVWSVDVKLPSPFWFNSPRLSVADMMATCGSAPAAVIPSLSDVLGFPEFNHWAAGDLHDGAFPRSATIERNHTDAGADDNTGVAALVARKVGNIVAFVNVADTADKHGDYVLHHSIAALFGQKGSGVIGELTAFQAKADHVFRSDASYERLVAAMNSAWNAGGPLIFESDHTTVYNPFFGVSKGNRVHMVWVLPGPPAGWLARHGSPTTGKLPKGSALRWFTRLPDETRRHIAPIEPGASPDRTFRDFPYIRVFFENGNSVLDLTNEQVNALSAYTCFSVLENRSTFLKLAK